MQMDVDGDDVARPSLKRNVHGKKLIKSRGEIEHEH